MILVTILEVNFLKPQAAGEGNATGYLCQFQSELGGGAALFVPASSRADPAQVLVQPVMVELEAEAIQGLQTLAEAGQPAPGLAPLDQPGDFTAVGMVRSIVWLDDAYENSVLEVQVGPALFSIVSTNEIGSQDLDYGQWVSFQLRGLRLWEIDR